MTEQERELLKITLTHEFYRCTQAFNEFCSLVASLSPSSSTNDRIDCYNSYVDFLSHLYEFYIGLIKRDSKFQQKGVYENYEFFQGKECHEKLDIIFNEEISKLFRNRKNRIIRGQEDSLGHRIDCYEDVIPKQFGKHFRCMRNRRNHTDFRRASRHYDISIKDFFNSYHKYILILYEECRWLWQLDETKFDCKEIDEFAASFVNN